MSNVHIRAFFRPAAPLLLGLGLLLAAALPTAAQEVRGRVVLEGEGVAGVPVELHRVTTDTAGVVESTTSGPDGAFSLQLPPPDSTGFTVHFATADFRGVRYFGSPLHPGAPLTGYTVEVFDTISPAAAAERPRVVRRDVIVLPGEDGSAEVDEIVQVLNPGSRTLAAPGGMPVWEFRIPTGVKAFEAGEGRISPEAVRRMGDRVFVTGSLTPGVHELLIRYRLAPDQRRTVLPLAAGTDSVNLFVRQPSPEVKVEGFGDPEVVAVERERFLHFARAGLQGRTEIVLAWKRPAPAPVDPRAAAVGVMGVLLAVGAGLALRRGPRRG